MELNNSVLFKKAKAITIFDDELGELINGLFKIMGEERGVGLAAPQVGISKAVFVMVPQPGVVINPRNVKTGGGLLLNIEGCLSLPERSFLVARPTAVSFVYDNLQGERVKGKLTGFSARVFLHEYQHLLGKTVDQVAQMETDYDPTQT